MKAGPLPVSEGTISHELPFIDVVRGGSSMLVAAAHVGFSTWPQWQPVWSSLGALAVDVFMIVSGFLMTISLCGKSGPKSINRENLLSFYLRRFFRISPAFYLAYALSLLLATTTFWNAVLHVTYLFGMSPKHSVEGPIVPFWSISLEMQFYVVVPFLLAAFRRLNAAAVLAVCVVVGLISSRLFGIYEEQGLLWDYPLPSFLPLSIGFFVTGIVLALHFLRSPHAPARWASVALILGSMAIHPTYKHVYAAGCGALFVLIFLACDFHEAGWWKAFRRRVASGLRHSLISRPARLLADYSYSLYLFHTFLIILLFQRTNAFSWLDSWPKPAAFFIATALILALGYAISFVVLHLVEKPGVRMGRRIERRLVPATSHPRA